ncbi:MAG: LPS export ABC transporter periplasmic protein LptC [Acidiphilium sp.]|nr:LPS export ABC transporter periplasmic protein LptC [Acidiphilium sp.]MDD4934651.1 LPS export ABC transporter periplasmic protein LptC [Acidiphilium sp.]
MTQRLTVPGQPEKPTKPASPRSLDSIFASLTQTRDAQRALLGRHRRAVSIFKFVLPALAALLITALAVFPNLRGGGGIGRISYKKQSTATGTPLSRMSVAQYRGVDTQGEKFTITANRVIQVSQDRLNLLAPKGDLTTNSGNWMMLNARHGLYHQNSQLLDLAGKVTLYRQDGTILHTSRAAIDIKGGTATGSDPVKAFGPFGTLHAQDGFLATHRGTDILFKGKSRVVLDQLAIPAATPNGGP